MYSMEEVDVFLVQEFISVKYRDGTLEHAPLPVLERSCKLQDALQKLRDRGNVSFSAPSGYTRSWLKFVHSISHLPEYLSDTSKLELVVALKVIFERDTVC